jgi:hypothetical protein
MVANEHYRKFYQYALHRCRGIGRWSLVRNPDSTWIMLKPE